MNIGIAAKTNILNNAKHDSQDIRETSKMLNIQCAAPKHHGSNKNIFTKVIANTNCFQTNYFRVKLQKLNNSTSIYKNEI